MSASTAAVATLVIVWFCAALVGCKPTSVTREQHREHPGRQLASHPARSAPLQDRLGEIPAVVLDYLRKDGRLNGYDATPRRHLLTSAERAGASAMFDSLPAEVRVMAEKFIAGIYIVENLGSSGWTEFIDSPDRLSFMVFDAQVFRETPNEWATRKERSAFRESAIEVELAHGANNLPGGALRFIFLHELGHAVGYVRRIHPTWLDPAEGEYPFTALAGTSKPFSRPVTFYGPPAKQTAASEAKAVYAAWSESEFPTLYATVSVDEDFAESFASYIHVRMLQQPYCLSVDGKRYDNGIAAPRCARREQFVAGLFGR